jgi:hypothetical protein
MKTYIVQTTSEKHIIKASGFEVQGGILVFLQGSAEGSTRAVAAFPTDRIMSVTEAPEK